MAATQARPLTDMPPSLPFPRVRDDDDLLYRLEVLRLSNGETEANLNDHYLHEAADLGLDIPADADFLRKAHMSTADSALTVASTHLSSDFAASRASISTGITSRSSTDHHYLTLGPLSPTSPRNDSSFSLPSFDEYDALLDLIRDETTNGSSASLSYQPQAPPASPVHSGSARMSFSVKRNIKRISGFTKGRGASARSVVGSWPNKAAERSNGANVSGSRSCTTCRNDLKLSSPICTLPCSHSYCRSCLHRLVIQAIDNESRLPPRCCLNPVPGAMVKMVLTESQRQVLMEAMHRNLPRWQSRGLLPSPQEPDQLRRRQAGLKVDTLSTSSSAAVRSVSSAEAKQRSLENKELLSLRDEQLEERDRFVCFERNQRQLSYARQEESKSEMKARHEAAGRELVEQHRTNATNLEDRHVAEEMEQRTSLEQQYKSCLVRLKHMEAYCYGPTGKDGRVVTDRNLRDLRQQYKTRDDMDRLHEAKINVLRERQAKQLEALTDKQEDEYNRMEERNKQEFDSLRKAFADENSEFAQVFENRKQALVARWILAEDILRKKLEEKHHLDFGPLPPVEFPIPNEDNDAELVNGTGQSVSALNGTGLQTQTPTPSEPRLDSDLQHFAEHFYEQGQDSTPRLEAQSQA
ncbi:hypothetical protein L228DRAFT_240946 [Xylona heveae TC161]|uniref:RING-type domain-containing protein n=1 Tax=Xylona heveae (strain CBS 132557 / TC161) TaxID=1328760 RepID=A0A165AG84_XYLHT|nr:hypothetical protein L228DRAFT_240946 [Xylona heveae TC161]KZF20424.1 hypothetical protein L228DRAFT_240946 [Xylona heveae TC161]